MGLLNRLFSGAPRLDPGAADAYVPRLLHSPEFGRTKCHGVDGAVAVGVGHVFVKAGIRSGETDHHERRALMWNLISGEMIPLHSALPPESCRESEALAIFQNRIAGVAYEHSSGREAKRLVVWHEGRIEFGSYCESIAAVWGDSIVGSIRVKDSGSLWGEEHAALWSVANLSEPIDLHPRGAKRSAALRVYRDRQVGWTQQPDSQFDRNKPKRAALWSGSSGTHLDLHPPHPVEESVAEGISEDRQVGLSSKRKGNNREPHATAWASSSGRVTDLHPQGASFSRAIAAANGRIIGHADSRPIVWVDDGRRCVDLHTALRREFEYSEALFIDNAGTIAGAAQLGTKDGPIDRAVVWIPKH